MPFALLFTEEAEAQYHALGADRAKQIPFRAVRKALGLISTDPNYSSLNTHPYHGMTGPHGERVIESYAQNRTPGAYRIFWHYGPPGAHPETGLQQDLVDPLTLKDAAILWTGEDPSMPEACTTRYKPILTAMVAAVDEGALKAHQDAFEVDQAEWELEEELGLTRPMTAEERGGLMAMKTDLAAWAWTKGPVPKFLGSVPLNRVVEPSVQAVVGNDLDIAEQKPGKVITNGLPNRQWMTRSEAADYLRMKPQTLAKWLTNNTHPELVVKKAGGKVTYSRQSVIDFGKKRGGGPSEG